MHKPLTTIAFALIALAPFSVLLGAGPTSKPAEASTRPSTQPEGEKGESALQGTVERASTTEDEVTVGGEAIKYRATAAKMAMKDEAGKLKATVFFVAYEQQRPPESEPAARPITFMFNGGPGAAAVWLHLGAAGPRRIDLSGLGEPPAPPYRLVPNEFSWLDATDLVFIDPVGTGFSRPAEGEKAEQFYGVREDINWVAEFIRLYLTEYNRWLSPKFVAGESYGTTRAALLSEHLLERFGIALNGIALISSVLNFQTLDFGDGNDLPYPLYLPTYAAIAWYHHRLPADLQADLRRTLREVEQWASHDYMIALAQGGRLTPGERKEVVERLARYTALPPELIERHDLRIRADVFQKYLLAEQRRIVGRFDGRITGFDLEPGSNRTLYDPSLSRHLAMYSATFNDYVRRTLKYDSTLPYEVLSNRVHPWKFGPEPGTGYLYVADNLRSAMAENPDLKVMFASGYFDLATPYFGTIYTIEHLDLGTRLRANIRQTFYSAGHMMYHFRAALEQLHTNVAGFIASAMPKKAE